MSQQPLCVLLVDDEASLREPLAKYLRQTHAYQVDTAANGQEALDRLEQAGGRYDVALIDDLLVPAPGREPEPLGVALIKKIKSRYPNVEIIIFTGWGMESGLEALRAGAYRYLAKPLNLEELGMLIQAAAEHGRLKGIAREKQILEQLMATSTTLLSGRSLPDVLDTILQGVQAIGFDRVGLYLLSDDRQMIVGQAQVGINPAFVGHERPVATDNHMQILLSDARPHVFEREDDQPLAFEQELEREDVYQWACVPLILHEEVIGKLTIDNKTSRRPILESELGPVALFASQAAAVIENARLKTKEQQATRQAEQRARNLAAIQEISTAISSTLDLDEILNETCRAVVELFGVDHTGLVLFEPSLEQGRVVAEYPDLGTLDVVIPVQGISAEEQLIQTSHPLAITHVSSNTALGPVCDILDQFNICSILIVPIIFEGRVLGSFSLDGIDHARTFTQDEIDLCKVFAAQLAVTVANARTHTNVQKYAQKLEILHKIDTEMAVALDLDHILQSIAKYIVRLVKASKSLFILIDYEQKCLIKTAGHGYPPEHLQNLTFEEIEAGVSGWVLQTGQPTLVSNAQSDPRNTGIALEKAKRFDSVPLIVAPLRVKGKVIGTLTAVNTSDDPPFSEEDLNLVVMLANQAANAIENAQLFTDTKWRIDRLEQLTQANSQIMGNLAIMPLDERLNLIAKYATGILDAEACSILLVKQPHFLSLEASYGHCEGGFQKGKKFAVCSGPRTGLTGHIAYEGKLFSAHGEGITKHFATKGPKPTHVASGECHSVLAIPLKKRIGTEEKLIGLLRADNKQDRTGKAGSMIGFTQEDEWIVRLFADAAVVAIEAAELVTQLSEQKNHWARLFASSPTGIIALDHKGNVTSFSDQAQKILKYSPEEVLNKPVDSLYDNLEEPRRVGEVLHLAKDGKVVNYETFVRSKDGERIPIRLAATWLYDAQGNQIGSVGYFEDFRVVKETESRLDLLLKASNTVAQAGNLSDSLQSLAEMMVTFLNVGFCRCFLLDENSQILLAKAAYPTSLQPDQLEWNPGPEGQIILTEWPLLAEVLAGWNPKLLRIDDKRHFSFLIERSHRLSLKQNIQSLFLVPLKTRNKVVGLLALAELLPWAKAPFSKQKQALAIAIADQVAMLIDRIYLYEITDRHRQLLEALDEASRNIRAEKETFKLLQETVRLAAELVDCTAGGLCINHPQLRELVLDVTFELPSRLIGSHLTHTEGLIGLVARTGQYQIIHNYSDWPDRENIFEAYHFKTVVGIPFKQAGEVEAVLFVADSTGAGRFAKADLDILERFAEQASIALQTSRLMDHEQRIFGQLTILHKISDYIQTARDLDKILHAVLTGITAGYGLGFNRAALFLLDESQESLIARMGIGHLDAVKARADWERDQEQGIYDFGHYLSLLKEDRLAPTPMGERIHGLRLLVQSPKVNVFSQVVRQAQFILVTQDELDKLPGDFVEAFEPALPLVVVPLIARDQVIGLLVADNKFTQSPITSEDVESLLTYANTTAVAIDNFQLLHETEVARARLRSFYRASNTLISSRDPEQVLHDIVEQVCLATQAYGASLVLIDQIGQVRHLVSASVNKAFDTNLMVRSDGLSMQIMQTGQPIIVEDTGKQRNRVNPSAFARGIDAVVGLPVYLEDKRIGVMWVDYDRPRHFSADEIDSMHLYVNQAAIAYDSAQRIKTLNHLRQAAEALAGVAELSEVLERIVQSAKEVLMADSAVIWSYDAVRDRFILERSVVAGISEEAWKEFQKIGPRKGGTTYNVMERGWVSVTDINDIQQYPFLDGVTQKLFEKIGARSSQGIALTAGEEILGVLHVNYNHRRSFSTEEHQTAQSFANHAALALKKAKLLDQVGKARNAAHVVAEVTALENIDDTLQSVAEGTIEVTNCDAVTVYVYDQGKDRLSHSPTMVGVRYPDKTRQFSKVERDSVVFKMLARDQMYIVDDSSADLLFRDRRFTRDEQIAACVAVPLKVGNEKVGVMFVNYRRLHRFTDDELINIELFAHQAAVAIRNVQLYEREQRRAKVLQALYEAGRAVTGSLDLEEILNHIVEQATRVTRYQTEQIIFASMRLVEKGKTWVVATYPPEKLLQAQDTCGDEIDLSIGGPDRIGIMGRAAKTGEPQRVDNVSTDPDYLECNSETNSELAIPIKLGDKVMGVINVEHPNYNAFDEEDQQALEALAAQAGFAIQNARLYDEVRQRAEQFQALYQASLNLTAELSVEAVLQEMVNYARQLTNARYGALGVRDSDSKMQPFITSGLEPVIQERIGYPPEAHGVLGLLLQEPKPIRERDVHWHPSFRGFPPHHPNMTSFLGVPVISKGTFIGNLYMANKIGTSEFSQEDQNVLELLAAQAAIAIQNARLFEQAQRRARLLDASATVARGATSFLDRNQLLNETVELIVESFDFCYHAGVFLLDASGQYAVLQTASSEGGQRMLEQQHKLKIGQEGIVGAVAATGEPRLTSNVEADPKHFANPDLPDTKAELAFPLKVRGEVIGVVDVQSRDTVDLRKEDIAALQTMVDQLANAIHNAQLFEQANQRLTESNVLREVAVSLAGAFELNDVLGLVVKEAMQLTETDGSSILLWDAASGKFTKNLKINSDGKLEEHPSRARAEGGLARKIVDEQRHVIIPDATQQADFNRVFIEGGYRATLGMPLSSQGVAMGVFYVRSKQPRQFSSRQIAMLEALANQAAVAIDRTRRYEAMMAIKGYIGSRTAIDWLKMVSTSWGHSIRREVGTARGRLELIRMQLDDNATFPQVKQELEQLDNVISGIAEIPILAPLSYEDAVDSVKINQTIKTYLDRQWRHHRFKPVKLVYRLQEDLDDIVTVLASQAWLRQGIEIIIDNAVYAMETAKSSKKQITVTSRLNENNHITISIQDTGPGIPPNVLARLFKQPVDKPKGSRGAGIGLMLAQTIFQTYRGNIWVETTGETGTEIGITLPVQS